MKGLSLCDSMVLAWLAGRKSCTRRMIGELCDPCALPNCGRYELVGEKDGGVVFKDKIGRKTVPIKPRYKPGEVVYLKEVWKFYDFTEDGFPIIKYRADGATQLILEISDDKHAQYVADTWARLSLPDNFKRNGRAEDKAWRSPMMMPEFLSRDRILIPDVRAEQIQEITTTEASLEGFESYYWGGYDFNYQEILPMIANFKRTWDTLHPGSWEKNEWVWRYGLEKVK